MARRVDGDLSLLGRDYLAKTVGEETGLPYNERPDGKSLILSARLNPMVNIEAITAGKSEFALVDRGEVAVAVMGAKALARATATGGCLSQNKLLSAAKGMERLETSDPVLFRYPWEMMAANGRALVGEIPVKGASKLFISPEAEVEEFVSFDPSAGPITIAEGTKVESFSRVSGPCYIGRGTVLRSARVRGGTTVAEGCRIGGELDSCIVYPHTNKAHQGFVGHSIVGEWVNVGAGATTSDLKNTYGTVKVQRQSDRVDSGLQKLGALVGDMAKISIGTMLYCGVTVGVAAHCAGLVDRDVPDFTSRPERGTKPFTLTLESVIETQQRMMKRREMVLSPKKRLLIERLYRSRGSAPKR